MKRRTGDLWPVLISMLALLGACGTDATTGTGTQPGPEDATEDVAVDVGVDTGAADVPEAPDIRVDSGAPEDVAKGPLAIISVKPGTGPVKGGVAVAIQGTGMRSGITILFGGAEATNVAVQGGILATCVVPPGEVGKVDVTVRNPDGVEATLPEGFEYVGELKVTSVVPVSGDVAGGNPAVVKGGGFQPGATVRFGDAEAKEVSVEGTGIITCTVPPGAEGPVGVTVRNPEGEAFTLEGGYEYVAETPIEVVDVIPDSGPEGGGDLAVIKGQGFKTGATVLFGETPAAGVVVQSSILITCAVPAGAPGVVDVTVRNPDQSSDVLEGAYEYLSQEVLTVQGVTPLSGPAEGGGLAVVKGTGFQDGATVLFGAAKAINVAVHSKTLISCVVPAGFPGLADVTVENPGGDKAVAVGAYEYLAAKELQIDQVTPSSGPVTGGGVTVVKGSGFQPGAAVTFGATPATSIVVESSSLITCTAPAGSAGFVDVVVQNNDGQKATLIAGYKYVKDEKLAVSEVQPSSGPASGGGLALVKGQGFKAGAKVLFGSAAAANVVVETDTLITCIVPAGAPGAVPVTVETLDGQKAALADGYTYKVDAPLAVVEVSPSSGPVEGGGFVLVKGQSFQPGSTVSFGGALAKGVTVESGSIISAVVPPGAKGTVDVVVKTPAGKQATLVGGYEYVLEATLAIAQVAPSKGPAAGGGLMVIKGQGFSEAATVKVGSSPATGVVVESTSLITCTAPAGAVGPADVSVSNPDGKSATLVGAYTYVADSVLTVTQVVPAAGPTEGGGLLVVKGTAFEPGATLKLGATAATAVSVESASLLTATAPQGSAGKVDVVVTNPGGAKATLQAGYEYVADKPLVVTQILPASGPVAGGGLALVKGQSFEAGAAVWFGDVAVTAAAVESSGLITITVPKGAVGKVDVQVKNPSGQEAVLPNGYEYVDATALALTQVLPSSGPASGGGVALVKGQGFAQGAVVRFGGVIAQGAVVESASLITATVPKGAAGKVDVSVTNPGGEKALLVAGYEYVADVPLAVTDVLPATGPASGGNLAVIKGQGFTAGATVSFGAAPATGVTVQSSTLVTAVVPAGAPGKVAVSVKLLGDELATLPGAYTYVEDAPLAVFAVEPAKGPSAGGNLAVVKGQGFASFATVRFGGTKALDVTVESPTLLTCTVPPGAAGTVDVQVQNPSGAAATLDGAYSYVAQDVLSVSSVFPSSGPEEGGFLVMVTGSGFGEGSAVWLGGEAGIGVTTPSTNLLLFLAPAHAAGVVDLSVMGPDGSEVALPGAFEYLAEGVVVEQAPAIGAVTPGTGPTKGGTPVQVLGTGFANGATVTFGGASAAVTWQSQSSLLAIAPAGSAGSVDVVVTNPDGKASTLAKGFKYVTLTGPAPEVTAVTPSSGPTTGGTVAAISGVGFLPGAQVWVGEKLAVQVVTSSEDLIVLTMPAGEPGVAAVTVVNPDGTFGTLADAFSYYLPGTVPSQPPLVGALFPSSGFVDGGDEVLISGSGFVANSTVYFGAAPATVTKLQGSSLLRVLTPPHTAGTVDVTVTNPQGLSNTQKGAFVYFEVPPFIGSVTPDAGPVAGGNTVVLTGKHFQDGLQVQVGGAVIQGVVLESTEELSITMPPHGAGPVDITVTNPGGLKDMTPGAYTYELPEPPTPPVVAGISPADGPAEGGVLAVVTGEGFAGTPTVTFGSIASPTVNVAASNVLTAVVPAGTPGSTVDVTVTNPSGLSDTLEQGFSYQTEAGSQPLAVAAVIPAQGPADGGTVVTVTGAGFVAGTTVAFGTYDAQTVTFVSPGVLTAVAPAAPAGLTDIVVERPDKQKVIAYNAFLFTTSTPGVSSPSVTSVSPGVGPLGGGTLVEVHGAAFAPGASVSFGAKASADVTFVSPALVVAKAPPASAGTVAVTVVNADGGSAVLPGAFTYYAPASPAPPLVLAADPYQGPALGGTEVVIFGKAFQPGVSIFLCGKKAEVTGVVPAEVTILTPPGALGPCDVTAVNPDGLSAVLEAGFKYVPSQPEITDLIPKSGPKAGGTSAVLHGGGFMAGAEVWFGAVKATDVEVWSAASIKAVTPAGDVGDVDVKVVNPGGAQAVLTAGFGYLDQGGSVTPPVISALFPSQGPVAGGTPVEIHGTGFKQGLTVLLGGGVVPQVAFISPEQVNLVTAPGAAGKVALTVLNPDGLGATMPNAFEYLAESANPPVLVGISPSTGPQAGGTPVTISGESFAPDGQLYVGGKPLLNQAFINSSVITGIVPKGAAAGKADLLYVGSDGQFAKISGAYVYTPGPKVDGVQPKLGPLSGGTQVTVIGTGFKSGLTVYFGGKVAQLVNLTSDLVVVVSTPEGPAPGFADVTVVNTDGQAGTLDGGFEFLAPPAISSIEPVFGPEAGGTPVTLHGAAFHSGAKVTFDGLESPQVVLASPGQITALTPAHAPGPVDVVVTNVDGQSVTQAQAFTFKSTVNLADPPTVSAMTPAQGPTIGGVTVTLTGTGFQEGALVQFGVLLGLDVARIDATKLLVKAPPAAAGLVAVTVINPDGQSAKAPGLFEYKEDAQLPAPPQLTAVSPQTGPTAGGTVVELIGKGFEDGMTVLFGSVLSDNVTVASATSAMVVTPPHAKGAVDITVISPYGQVVKLPGAFSYMPPPKVLAVTPKAAPSTGGTLLKITGDELAAGAEQATVLFCVDYAAGNGCVSADLATQVTNGLGTQIDLLAPPHAPGTVDVTVVNPDGQKHTLSQGFVFNPLPVILGVSPGEGSSLGNTIVTMTGSGFQQGATVTVGGTPCKSLIFQSAGTILCTTPAGAVGMADVAITNPDGGAGSLTDAFLYVPPPTITKITPNTGPETGGTQVTIEGNDFVQGPPGSEVRFGNVLVPPEDTTVVDNKVIFVKTPPGTGSVKVSVTNPDGQKAEISGGFVYVPPTPPPVISYVVPNKGSTLGGYVVQVVGAAFMDGAVVMFGSEAEGWVEGIDIQVKNAGTLITLLAPAHDAGVVDVRVLNTDNQEVTKLGAFEFKAPASSQPLTYTSISPSKGLVAGGTISTVTGQGFAAGAQVYFGHDPDWVKAASTVRVGPTLLRVEAPPAPNGVPEVVDIKVANPPTQAGQESVVAPSAYEYSPGTVFRLPDNMRLPPEPHSDLFPLISDYNGDGFNDVVVFRNGQDRMLVNVPPSPDKIGWFQHQWPWNGPSNYMNYNKGTAVAGDVDEDGDIDVFVRISNASNRVYKCTNDGSGKFACGEVIGSNGCNIQRLLLTDLNCDGHLDLMAVNYSTSTSCPNWIYTGDGAGKFKNMTTVQPTYYENTRAVVAADVDLDGDVDLLLGNDDAGQNRLYYNNCNNITDPAEWIFADALYGGGKNFPVSGGNTRDVALVDLDQNGYPDAIVANYGQQTEVYLNAGGSFDLDDGFHWPQQEENPNFFRIYPTDIDLDGDVDVITYGLDNSVRIYVNDLKEGGAGLLHEESEQRLPPDPSRGDGVNITVGDLNSDLLPDIYIVDSFHQDRILINGGYMEGLPWTDQNRVQPGYFVPNISEEVPEEYYVARASVMGDIDGDGDEDLIKCGWHEPIRIFVNEGGRFVDESAGRITDVLFECPGKGLSLEDLDGDGSLDVLLAERYDNCADGICSGALHLFINDGNGVFEDLSTENTSAAWQNECVKAADIDLDGDLDVFLGAYHSYYWQKTGMSAMLLNGGDPFNTGAAYFFDVVETWFAAAKVNSGFGESVLNNLRNALFVDVDGVPPLDMYLVRNGQNQLFLNSGDNEFVSVTNAYLPSASDNSYDAVIADFDGDGDEDIFSGNWGKDRFYTREGLKKYSDVTTSSLPDVAAVSMQTHAVAAADLDGDGLPEVVEANHEQQNSFFGNLGETVFTDLTANLPTDWDRSYGVHLVDVDGDGDLDIYVVNEGQDRIYINTTY